jgi:hypothetical protein
MPPPRHLTCLTDVYRLLPITEPRSPRNTYVPRCSPLGSIIFTGLTGQQRIPPLTKNHEITDLPSASACFCCPVADYLVYYQVLVHTIWEI